MARDPIELRELRCFAALAEELHTARAAARVGVSEDELLRTVVELEAKVGVPLLGAAGAPTEAGERFLDGALDALAAIDGAVEAARGANGVRPERHLHVVEARLDALQSTLLELISAFGMLASELALRGDLQLSTPRELEEALERGWRALVEDTVLVPSAALPDEASAALRAAMEKTGARVGAIYELPDEGDELRLLAAEGYPDEVMAHFRSLPLDADLPAAVVARTGRPLWFREREEILDEFPVLRPHHERTERAIGRRGEQGAVVPVSSDERVVAVLVIGFAAGEPTLRSV